MSARIAGVLCLALCSVLMSACSVNGTWEGELELGSEYFDLSWDVVDKQIAKLEAVGFGGDWDVTYRFSPKITVDRQGSFDYDYKMQGVEVLYFDGTLDKRKKTGEGKARLYYDYGGGVLFFKNRVPWDGVRTGRKASISKQGGEPGLSELLLAPPKTLASGLLQMPMSSFERVSLSADLVEQEVKVLLPEGGVLKALLVVSAPSGAGASEGITDFSLERVLPSGEVLADSEALAPGEEVAVRVVRTGEASSGLQTNVTLLLSAE